MKIYIAGPMRGYPRWNFAAFDGAFKRWKEAGHDPISPANIDRALGVDPDGPLEQIDGDFGRRAMQLDITLIYGCEAIALLPGWQKSSGATVELSLALYLGLCIFDAVSMVDIFPSTLPWNRDEEPIFEPLTKE